MSSSRPEKSDYQSLTSANVYRSLLESKFGQDYECVIRGGTVGAFTTTCMYPIDRVSFIVRTSIPKASIAEIGKQLLNHPLKGLIPSVLKGGSQFATIFSIKPMIKDLLESPYPNGPLNDTVAKGVAAGCTKYLFYPISVIEGYRYRGYKLETIMELSAKDFFRGANTSALSHALSYPIYCTTLNIASRYTDNTGLQGTIATIPMSLISSPLSTIADHQSLSQKFFFSLC